MGAVGSIAGAATGGGGTTTGGGGGSASGGASASGSGASGGASGRTSQRQPSRARDGGVKSAQQGVVAAGPRAERKAVVIRFSLRRPAIVRFLIVQESPTCARVGSFTVRGKAGRNRVAFTGRIRGNALPPGTYSLSATAFRNGTPIRLGRARVVIVDEGKSVERVRPAPSVCARGVGASVDRFGNVDRLETEGSSAVAAPGGGGGASSGEELVPPNAGEPDAGGAESNVASRAAGGTTSRGAQDGRALGVLPDPFERGPGWLQALLLSVLAASIMLLVAAALPATAVRPVGAAAVVDRTRTQLALVGATLLGVVAVAALAI